MTRVRVVGGWRAALFGLALSCLMTAGCSKDRSRHEADSERVTTLSPSAEAAAPAEAQSASQPESADQAESAPLGSKAAWIDRLRRVHQAADSAASPEQRRLAVAGLRGLLSEIPSSNAEDLRWVKQDVHFRIAKLELQQGAAQAAVDAATDGLQLSKQPSVAVSNLFMVQAQALEQLERKDEAIEAYHQALLVNEVLMKRSLGEE